MNFLLGKRTAVLAMAVTLAFVGGCGPDQSAATGGDETAPVTSDTGTGTTGTGTTGGGGISTGDPCALISVADASSAAGTTLISVGSSVVADKHICTFISMTGGSIVAGWVEGDHDGYETEKATMVEVYNATDVAGLGDEAFTFSDGHNITIVTFAGGTIYWVAAADDLPSGGDATARAITTKLLAS